MIFSIIAIVRGGWAERTASIAVLIDWFLTPIVQTSYSPDLPLILLDGLEVITLFVVSYYSRRLWTVLITANALGGLLAHLADLIISSQHRMSWAYVTIAGLMGGMFVALSLGAAVVENELLRKREK